MKEVSTPEESLQSLEQLALYIDRSDLHDMSQIGKGIYMRMYVIIPYQRTPFRNT